MAADTTSSPLLSIVIPTRNRAAYAIAAIQSILEIRDPRLELIIQDNSDGLELEEWVRGHVRDQRLRYNRTPTPLSFIHNFDAAARLATGKYLCFIGDDDGVNPEVVESAAWAECEGMDALVVKPSVHYLWRGSGVSSTLFTEVTGGSLTVGDFTGHISRTNPEHEMKSLLRSGGLYYLNTGLPKLYHGLVHRRCLDAVYEKTGAYFGGLSPDTYAALAIACVASKVAVLDYPLTIPGSCAVSGAIVEGATKRHSKRLEDAPHLRHRGAYEWSDLVPRIYTVETLWVDSSIAALRAMGREDLISHLNLPRLAALTIAANRGVTLAVWRGLVRGLRVSRRSIPIGMAKLVWALVILWLAECPRLFKRAWNRALMVLGMRTVHQIDGLDDMVQASHTLTRYLDARGQSFLRCVRQAAHYRAPS